MASPLFTWFYHRLTSPCLRTNYRRLKWLRWHTTSASGYLFAKSWLTFVDYSVSLIKANDHTLSELSLLPVTYLSLLQLIQVFKSASVAQQKTAGMTGFPLFPQISIARSWTLSPCGFPQELGCSRSGVVRRRAWPLLTGSSPRDFSSAPANRNSCSMYWKTSTESALAEYVLAFFIREHTSTLAGWVCGGP